MNLALGRGIAAWSLAAALLVGCADAAAPPADTGVPTKVLRYAFLVAETGFDPARHGDLYSRIVTAHIFDPLYVYDPLAQPARLIPNTAVEPPEQSADHRVWTVRLKPGIHFADDPAFGGKPRELIADDYVYAFKRLFDPALNSPAYTLAQEQGVLGLDALRQEALKLRKPFDYDRAVEGVRALDRHTLQFRLAEPRPRFAYVLADNGLAALAREVVERYGDHVGEHPVGTGPFRLAQWRRSSFIALERNPGFREQVYDAQPAADDAEGQALLARLKGRRLPMIDRVEISVMEESQPRWLAFLNREFDLAWPVPPEFAADAAPNGRLAPHLARRGITMQRVLANDRTFSWFNMEDATVGGYTAEKIALRRAIALAIDVRREIDFIRRGQAVQAQSLVSPGSYGYDPALRITSADYSPARAQALLDLHGYVDRDGDGWRDQPDGSPLVIRYASSPDATLRQFDELWKHCMNAIRVRLEVKTAQWPEQLKAARAGQLMVWQLGMTSGTPDVQEGMTALYGPAAGGQNLARFAHPGYDTAYRRMQSLEDGPERLAQLRRLQAIAAAYAPVKPHVHRVLTDLSQPWLIGYRRPAFGNRWWLYVDIDSAQQAAARGK